MGGVELKYEEESYELNVTIDDKLSTTTMFTYDGDHDFSGFLFYDNTNKYMVNDRGEIIDNNSIKFGLEKESYVRRIGLNIGEVGETQSDKNKNRMVYVNKEILVGEVGILYDEDKLNITKSSNGDDWKDKYYVEFIDVNANKKIQLIVEIVINDGIIISSSIIEQIGSNTIYSINDIEFNNPGVSFNIKNGDDIVYAYRSRDIGGGEFGDNNTLLTVYLTSDVKDIGDFAFNNCSSLTQVIISNGVKDIGEYAFHDCTSLTKVEIPNSVTSIGSSAFYGCSKLTQIIISNSVETIDIGESAFYGCSSLTKVEIPNSIKTIEDGAFFNCSSLTQVIIRGSPTYIGGSAFNTTSTLTIYCNKDTESLIINNYNITFKRLEELN